MPVSLSIEEQNVKNSILRLNDRLNGKWIISIFFILISINKMTTIKSLLIINKMAVFMVNAI